MTPFKIWKGVVAPLDRANVDTDSIIPKQFMKSISRTGFGDNLFDEWRYLDTGEPGQDCSQRPRNPDFVLNRPEFKHTSILLTRGNFGCGSSREHAPWALRDFGIRALIAPSFADIFSVNCVKNGLLPAVLSEAVVQSLFEEIAASPGIALVIDLPAQQIMSPAGSVHSFTIDADRKEHLIDGLDEISRSLKLADDIRRYERERMAIEPWAFTGMQ